MDAILTRGLPGSLAEAEAARQLAGQALRQALCDSRARALAWTFDLPETAWRPARRAGINPVAWELAHIGWFAEHWTVRAPRPDADGRWTATLPPRWNGPDEWFDSSRLPHARRWHIRLPDRQDLLERLHRQLLATLATVPDEGADDASLQFLRLALFHEDMHAESFAWTRAALGAPAPGGLVPPRAPGRRAVRVPAGTSLIGRPPGPGFAFDNEQPACPVALAAFEIDDAPVSAGDFLRFVEAGGYDDPRWWPGDAGAWRRRTGARHPLRWRRVDGVWTQRWFDRWMPLDPSAAMLHVNAWEAEAWARWSGRRLPHAAEWEAAVVQGAVEGAQGVWEWTADDFGPRPGFRPGPYREYSAPWFVGHRELRGGSFAAHARIRHPQYRNFFGPDRRDVFAGFRTARTLDPTLPNPE